MRPMLHVGVLCGVLVVIILALTTKVLGVPQAQPCTQAWFQYLHIHYVETIRNLDEDDDVDGGPDPGDGEWVSGFESMTRITTPPHLSDQQRCQRIHQTLKERIYIVNPTFGWSFILTAG